MHQFEVMLEVGGEGGGYSILGEEVHGSWQFWRAASGGDDWMWDEKDDSAKTHDQELPTTLPKPPIRYFQTLDEALGTINSCWPILFPVAVHPAIAAAIWTKVEAYIAKYPGHDRHGYIRKWKEQCQIR